VSASSPLFVALMLVLSAVLGGLLARWHPPAATGGRYASIDGLRGYLAFGVFIHHGAVWYFYLRDASWDTPPTRLYHHLGQSAVVFFFMITSFLFYDKVLDADRRPLDWLRLYISRFLRLTPLYVIVVVAMALLSLQQAGWQFQSSPWALFKDVVRWLSFTMLGAPDLNGFKHTSIMVAGVTWSLPYAWLFYFCLPVLAWVSRRQVPWGAWCVVALGVVLTRWWSPSWLILTGFVGGLVAAVLVRQPRWIAWSRHPLAGFIPLVCAGLLVFGFEGIFEPVPMVLAGLAFAVVAGGNGVFGLLTWSGSRALGEVAYSIYLLHGLLLFVLFKVILPEASFADRSVVQHWLLIGACAPVLILLSQLSFTHIEARAMAHVNGWTAWIRQRGVLVAK